MESLTKAASAALPHSFAHVLAASLQEDPESCARALKAAITELAVALSGFASTGPAGVSPIFRVMQECGFDSGAITRLQSVELSTHLEEIVFTGWDLTQDILGPDAAPLASSLSTRFALRPESSSKLLGAAMVFLLATLGYEAPHDKINDDLTIEMLAHYLGTQSSNGSSATTAALGAQLATPRTTSKLVEHATLNDEPLERTLLRAPLPLEASGMSDVPQFARFQGDDEDDVSHTPSRRFHVPWISLTVTAVLVAGVVVGMKGAERLIPSWNSDHLEVSQNNYPRLQKQPEVQLPSAERAAFNPALLAQEQTAQESSIGVATESEGIENSVPPSHVAAVLVSSIAEPELKDVPLSVAMVPSVDSVPPQVPPTTQQTQKKESLTMRVSALLSTPGKLNRADAYFPVSQIQFVPGRASLQQELPEDFVGIAPVLAEYKRSRIQIDVSAESYQGKPPNLGLAQLRAELLKNELVSRGVSRGRIDARGVKVADSSEPAEPATSQELVTLTILRK